MHSFFEEQIACARILSIKEMVQVVQLSSLTLEKSNLTSTLAIRIGIDEVFGKNYLENRRNSGSSHFDENVTRHEVYIYKKKRY